MRENQPEPSIRANGRKSLRHLIGKALREPGKIPRAAWTELRTLSVLARHGMPDVLLQFLGGIGDELLLTAVAYELRKRDPGLKIWQVSSAPDLLDNNPTYHRIFGVDRTFLRYSNVLNGKRRLPLYTELLAANRQTRGAYLWRSPARHIIAEMCASIGIKGKVSLRPYVFLSDHERAMGSIAERQIVVHCAGVGTYGHFRGLKQWMPERFQIVVDEMSGLSFKGRPVKVIQLGVPGDPRLEGALDLRGKTSLRETAAIISRSLAVVSTVGLMSHLARAVDTRAVILHGGLEKAWQSGYSCNENLQAEMECSPCWRQDDCPFGIACMRMITPEMVLAAIGRVVERHEEPLPVDMIEI